MPDAADAFSSGKVDLKRVGGDVGDLSQAGRAPSSHTRQRCWWHPRALRYRTWRA
jgi:hypothetical protein